MLVSWNILFYLIVMLQFEVESNSFRKFSEIMYLLQKHHTVKTVVLLWNSQDTNRFVMKSTSDLQKNLSKKYVMTVNYNINDLLVNVTMQKQLRKQKHLCSMLPMANLSNINTALKKISSLNLMKRNAWIVLLEDSFDLNDLFEDVYIPFDSQFLVVSMANDGSHITEIYKVKKDQPLTINHYGYWTENQSTKWPDPYLYKRRRHLQGVTLIVGANKGYPVVDLEEINGKIELTGGTIKPVTELLKNHLNFRTHYKTPIDKKWGTLENGTWSGMIGMLLRNEIDLITNMISMTPERSEIMDFLTTVSVSRLLVYMKKPVTSGMTWRSYILPFSSQLWVAVVILMFIIAVVLSLLEVWYYARNFKHSFLTLIRSWLDVIGSFCSQGTFGKSYGNSYSLAVIFSFASSIVLLSSYSAFIVSYLAVQREELPFSDFPSMLADGSYSLGMLAHSSVITMFKNTSNSEWAEVYRKLIAPIEKTLPYFTLNGLHRVCQEEKFTFLTFDVIAEPCSEVISCQLVKLPGVKYMAHFTMPTAKNSPYTSILSHTVLKLIQGGILKKIASDFQKKYDEDSDIIVHSITVGNTATIFMLLFIGICVSFFMFILEFLYNGISKTI